MTTSSRSAKELRELMDKLKSPALHSVYDVAGAVMTHETPEDYFTHLAGRVAHVHFTDSDAGGSTLAWAMASSISTSLVAYLRSQNYEGC